MDATVPAQLHVLTTKTRMKVLGELSQNSAKTADNEESRAKRDRLRSKVVAELLSTERTYVKHLNLISDFFMNPIRERQILSAKEFSVIFGQIGSISGVNHELLNQLESSEKSVGAAFLELAPYLKLYCSYAKGFEEGIVTMQNLEKERKEFSTFVSNQETRPEIGMKLNSLLITPIQRIPRYKLLLEELLLYTHPKEAGYKLLEDALKEISIVADLINNRMREHDNMQKMLSIQRSLIGSQPKLVIPGRKFIKEGPLMKVSRNGGVSRRRIFYLFNDMLMYCKQRGPDYDRPDSLSCCCVLPIKHCQVESLFDCGRKHGTLMKLTCKDETLLLFTDDPVAGDAWIKTLRETATQYVDYRRTLRKESSAKRPLRRTALLKTKEESLSKLHRKRKIEAVEDEPEIPVQSSGKGSLFSVREMEKVRKCISTPMKRPRLQTYIDGACPITTPKHIAERLASENAENANDLSIIQEDSMTECAFEGFNSVVTSSEETDFGKSVRSTPKKLSVSSADDTCKNDFIDRISNSFSGLKRSTVDSHCVIL